MGTNKTTRCDDADVMRLWRECGLPEWFLGNGGTNHRLVEFASRLRARQQPPRLRRACETTSPNRNRAANIPYRTQSRFPAASGDP